MTFTTRRSRMTARFAMIERGPALERWIGVGAGCAWPMMPQYRYDPNWRWLRMPL
jgi:hypothetical protein